MTEPVILAGGRPVAGLLDNVRRYCGLPWTGGPPETWAWPYFDAVPTACDDMVAAVDVVCAAALHPGLSRDDLDFFLRRSEDLSAWLAEVPTGVPLCEIDAEQAAHLRTMPALEAPSITLLSKVLHRKRPAAVPLLDRHVLDRYRPLTGERVGERAWSGMVDAMRTEQHEQRTALESLCAQLEGELDEAGIGGRLTAVRLVDIGIWMVSR